MESLTASEGATERAELVVRAWFSGDLMPERERPPIDLGHLRRQTAGDQSLALEVLQLYAGQLAAAAERVAATIGASDLQAIAHGLCGASRNVGAFALADLAKRVEREGDGTRELLAEVGRTKRFLHDFLTSAALRHCAIGR